MLTRVAILGDIHAEDLRLAAALDLAHARGVDAVLSVGDIVDGRGDAGRCCRLLRERGVRCVRGNHDRWWSKGTPMGFADGTPRDALTPDEAQWLAALPPSLAFDTPMGSVLLCHGLGENDMAAVEPADEGYALEAKTDLQELIDRADHRVIVNGHTHSRMVRRMARRLWIVNAGTLKGEQEPGFGIVDFEARVVEWLEFGGDEVPAVVGGQGFGA